MVPPTPGPLMTVNFENRTGYALMAGLIASLPLALLVLWMAGLFEKKYEYPMREVGGISSRDLEDTLAKDLRLTTLTVVLSANSSAGCAHLFISLLVRTGMELGVLTVH